jgi:hypothetical protein
MEKNKDTIDEMCVFSKDLSWDQLREFMNDRDNRYNSEYIKRMEINEDIHLYTGVRNRKIFDILPALKDGDSSFETAMPDRKNVPCCVNIALMSGTALSTSPFSYS